LAVRLHTARHVHGLAPEVIAKLLAADDTRDHGARVDADAEGEPSPAERPAADLGLHVERQVHQGLSVIGTRAWHASGDHVAVADRLDLL
jgi:hypothetical protein